MMDIPLVDTPQGKIRERRAECKQCHVIEQRLVEVELAFPDGPQKHAAYHLAKINAAKEEAEFWKSAKAELTKNGVATIFGALKLVMTLAALGLMYKLGLGAVADHIIK